MPDDIKALARAAIDAHARYARAMVAVKEVGDTAAHLSNERGAALHALAQAVKHAGKPTTFVHAGYWFEVDGIPVISVLPPALDALEVTP